MRKLVELILFNSEYFKLSIIVIILWSIQTCLSTINVSPLNVEGFPRDNVSVTVTWTNESIFTLKIQNEEISSHETYSTECRFSNCSCNQNGISNIKTICDNNSLMWTFSGLEIRNNGRHSILIVYEIGMNAARAFNEVLIVNVLAKPADISLSCNTNDCNNSLNCQCQATSGNPKSSINWILEKQNGKQNDLSHLSHTKDYEMFGNMSSSLIYELQREEELEEGRLICVVKNRWDSINESYSFVKMKSCSDEISRENVTEPFSVLLSIVVPCVVGVAVIILITVILLIYFLKCRRRKKDINITQPVIQDPQIDFKPAVKYRNMEEDPYVICNVSTPSENVNKCSNGQTILAPLPTDDHCTAI